MNNEPSANEQATPAFTPGPWYYDHSVAIHSTPDGGPKTLIALVYSQGTGRITDNARLIAAAPELFALLNELVGIVENEEISDSHTMQTLLKQARAALAKAQA